MAESSWLERPGLDKAAGEEFLREAFQVLLDEAVRKGTDVTEKVCDWKEPQELRELLDLELRSSGELPERLLERCRDVIRYSVKTCENGLRSTDVEDNSDSREQYFSNHKNSGQ